MEKIKLGTAYIDEFPLSPGLRSHKSDRISIGDTISSFAIQWVRLSNGLLVADRCICNNVSWEQLNASGLVFGKVIQIDGSWYLCRCLKVGVKGCDPNEWDATLAEAGEDDEVWCWMGQYFWGQETPEDWVSGRAVRGWVSARHWDYNDATIRNVGVGFRPVLDALALDTLVPDGATVMIGTLYMDDQPVKVPMNPTEDGDIPDYIHGAKLVMGAPIQDAAYQVQAIKVSNVLIADRVLLKNISLEDLHEQGIC